MSSDVSLLALCSYVLIFLELLTMMLRFQTAAVLSLLLALSSHAFHSPSKPIITRSAANQSSTTQLHLFDLLNEGKKALVKKLAGDYDAAAIRARLDGLIQDNAVLMLSFTT